MLIGAFGKALSALALFWLLTRIPHALGIERAAQWFAMYSLANLTSIAEFGVILKIPSLVYTHGNGGESEETKVVYEAAKKLAMQRMVVSIIPICCLSLIIINPNRINLELSLTLIILVGSSLLSAVNRIKESYLNGIGQVLQSRIHSFLPTILSTLFVITATYVSSNESHFAAAHLIGNSLLFLGTNVARRIKNSVSNCENVKINPPRPVSYRFPETRSLGIVNLSSYLFTEIYAPMLFALGYASIVPGYILTQKIIAFAGELNTSALNPRLHLVAHEINSKSRKIKREKLSIVFLAIVIPAAAYLPIIILYDSSFFPVYSNTRFPREMAVALFANSILFSMASAVMRICIFIGDDNFVKSNVLSGLLNLLFVAISLHHWGYELIPIATLTASIPYLTAAFRRYRRL